MKDKILELSHDLFNQRGVKSVTMDDIARKAGISKKTLYEQFDSKSLLVYECLSAHIQDIDNQLSEIAKDSTDALEAMVSSISIMEENISNLYPGILAELYKYYPDSFAQLEAFRIEILIPWIGKTIKRGKIEDLFIKDIDENLIAKYRVLSIFYLINEYSSIANYRELIEMQNEMNVNFIRGLLTDKGRKNYLQIQRNLTSNEPI